jgi:multiple sugar transport system permease protein
MGNSIFISVMITLGMIFHGTCAGYAYARLPFRGRRIMFSLMLITMMIPIHVIIIPLYKIMSVINLVNTPWAVIMPSLFGAMCPGLSGAFGIFLMRQFFLGMPREFEEAAAIDGASPLRTFFLIMIPQAKSTIVSLAIIVFSASWNDYFTPFIMINNTQKMPLPVGILAIRQPFATGDQFELAAIVLSVLPVLIIFIVGQKGIIKSMIQAGIKG